MAWINRPKRNATRKPDNSRKARMAVYNRSLWRKLRDWKLRTTPLCEVCRLRGETKAAEDIHHLRTFTGAEGAERDALAYDPENLLSVCDRCHRDLHHGALHGLTTIEDIEKRIKQNS